MLTSRTQMAVAFTAAYNVYYQHFYSASETSRRAVGVSKKTIHKVDFGKVLGEAIRFKYFCDGTPLLETQELATCLTALQCFTGFLKPTEQIAVADTAFTRLYEQNPQFTKQWLLALQSILEYVGPLNGGTVNRIATGIPDRLDALWLLEYDIQAIIAKLTVAKAEEVRQIVSRYKTNTIRESRSQLDTGHVLHSMRAVLDASSKF